MAIFTAVGAALRADRLPWRAAPRGSEAYQPPTPLVLQSKAVFVEREAKVKLGPPAA